MAPNAAPRRNYYLFGRPFHTTAVDPANADACDALYGAVRTQVELQVEYLLQRRGDDPYDDFVKRLAYELWGASRRRSLWTSNFVVMYSYFTSYEHIIHRELARSAATSII